MRKTSHPAPVVAAPESPVPACAWRGVAIYRPSGDPAEDARRIALAVRLAEGKH